MDLIKEMLEELGELVLKEFPNYTTASFSTNADGYLSICVTEWEKEEEKPVEARKRKELFDQHRISKDDAWVDGKEMQNGYYEKLGVLLEGKE